MKRGTEIPYYAAQVERLRDEVERFGADYIHLPYTVVPLGQRLDLALANLARVATLERQHVPDRYRRAWH